MKAGDEAVKEDQRRFRGDFSDLKEDFGHLKDDVGRLEADMQNGFAELRPPPAE